jgi:hypothetical protein
MARIAVTSVVYLGDVAPSPTPSSRSSDVLAVGATRIRAAPTAKTSVGRGVRQALAL